MLSIFRKKDHKDIKRSGKDNTISSEDLVNIKEETSEEEIETTLSLHPSWSLSNEQQYVFRFLHNELKPLKPNQISIAGVDLNYTANGIEVTAFVRNSLQKKVAFGETTLLLLDDEQNLIAREVFDLGKLGQLPERSSMPWVFLFPLKTIKQSEFKEDNWTLAFELNKPHSLDLHESWEKSLSDEEKEKLQKLMDSVGAPKKGEVNFLGIQAQQDAEKNLSVSVLIRNGTDKNVQLHNLPLILKDASNNIAAEGGFKLDDFTIKANTSRPWTFIFPASLIKSDQLDLSKWSIGVKES